MPGLGLRSRLKFRKSAARPSKYPWKCCVYSIIWELLPLSWGLSKEEKTGKPNKIQIYLLGKCFSGHVSIALNASPLTQVPWPYQWMQVKDSWVWSTKKVKEYIILHVFIYVLYAVTKIAAATTTAYTNLHVSNQLVVCMSKSNVKPSFIGIQQFMAKTGRPNLDRTKCNGNMEMSENRLLQNLRMLGSCMQASRKKRPFWKKKNPKIKPYDPKGFSHSYVTLWQTFT